MPSLPQLVTGPDIIVDTTLEELVALELENAHFGVRGETIFEGPLSDSKPFPDAAIGVLEAAGGTLEPLAGATAADLGTVRIQIMVRSKQNAYTANKKRAEQIVTALHKRDFPEPVYACFADTPLYVRKDKQGRHYHSVNLTLKTHTAR